MTEEREVYFVGGGPLDGRTRKVPATWKKYTPTTGPHTTEYGTYYPEKGKPGRWRWKREGTREGGTS